MLNDVVCGLHRAQGDKERRFLVESQNQDRRFDLKTTGMIFSGLGTKSL
jgi:hypothetical protein